MYPIGETRYLSTLPLTYPLRVGAVPTEVMLVTGGLTDLSLRLLAREIVAGPVSVATYLAHRDRLELVPNVALSSWGRASCGVLFCKGPLGPREGFEVAVPSRTAGTTHLLSSLLGDLFGLVPTFSEDAGSLQELLATYDAVLLFEDEAFAATQDLPPGIETWDLGDAWWQFTNTPLIYTLWAMHKDLPAEAKHAVTVALHRAKSTLPYLRSDMVAEGHAATGMPANLIEGYLTRFNYDFTPAHAQGLALLEQRMQEHGLSV